MISFLLFYLSCNVLLIIVFYRQFNSTILAQYEKHELFKIAEYKKFYIYNVVYSFIVSPVDVLTFHYFGKNLIRDIVAFGIYLVVIHTIYWNIYV